jgi:hypothetical protein
MGHGFGWFTVGSSLPSRFRERGVRRGIRTPKRYPALAPFTPQEQLVIEQLRAERLKEAQK